MDTVSVSTKKMYSDYDAGKRHDEINPICMAHNLSLAQNP